MYPIVHHSTVYNQTWKQAKCLSTEEWIKNMWHTEAHACMHMRTHTHILEYYSAVNNEIMPLAEIMPIANNANCQRLSY